MSEGFYAGLHILNGSGANLAVNYASQLGVVKCVQDYWICQEIKRRNPQVKTIARTLVTDYGMVDGPPVWAWNDPSLWWGWIKNHLPDGFDYYEIINEVGPPPQGWEYWAQWHIAIAQMVERDKGGKLLAFSFGPGNPDYPEWPKLIEYLRWAAVNGHGVAIHAAPFMSLPVPSAATWVNNDHLAGRIILVCNQLEQYGFDCYDVQWWETEVGLSDGYSGLWDYPWSCEQIADAYKTTVRILSTTTPVTGINWWNIGQLSRWTDDSRCLAQMIN